MGGWRVLGSWQWLPALPLRYNLLPRPGSAGGRVAPPDLGSGRGCELSGPPPAHSISSGQRRRQLRKGSRGGREEGQRQGQGNCSPLLPATCSLKRTWVGRESRPPVTRHQMQQAEGAPLFGQPESFSHRPEGKKGALTPPFQQFPLPFWVWSRSFQPPFSKLLQNHLKNFRICRVPGSL